MLRNRWAKPCGPFVRYGNGSGGPAASCLSGDTAFLMTSYSSLTTPSDSSRVFTRLGFKYEYK